MPVLQVVEYSSETVVSVRATATLATCPPVLYNWRQVSVVAPWMPPPKAEERWILRMMSNLDGPTAIAVENVSGYLL